MTTRTPIARDIEQLATVLLGRLIAGVPVAGADLETLVERLNRIAERVADAERDGGVVIDFSAARKRRSLRVMNEIRNGAIPCAD